MFSIYVLILEISFITSSTFCLNTSSCLYASYIYESNKQTPDLIFNRTTENFLELECIKQNLNLLGPDELSLLFNVIDEHLIDKNDNLYCLIVELSKSSDVYCEIKKIQNELRYLPTAMRGRLSICPKDFHIISSNRKRIQCKSNNLKYSTKKCTKILKTELNCLNLSRNKLEFYVFVFEFVERCVDLITMNTFKCQVKLHYQYLLDYYRIYSNYIKMLISEVSLPKILNYAEKCLVEESNINFILLCKIRDELMSLDRIISNFYINLDNYLSHMEIISNLIIENIQKN
ncbi:putative SP-containing protein [Vairimorpha necatrix]|uniref:SP-containing protein n=1 Tax=Vairimorpha necatrix TaxID=6039 RepID=A0AAX4JEU3_9MICR